MDMPNALLKQHLIDPEICIRCNTCEAICPVGAITHDSRNYVVDAGKCNLCMACVPPCPTGSIDNWRSMPLVRAYSVDEQLGWDELPAELPAEELAAALGGVTALAAVQTDALETQAHGASGPQALAGEQSGGFDSGQYGATQPPWSAAHPYINTMAQNQSTNSSLRR